MFTGIIEEIGKITGISDSGSLKQLTISCQQLQDDLSLGDSVCCNGICLTVNQFDKNSIKAAVMPETVRKTTITDWKIGSSLNLERALTLQTRLGGHLVQGHVDSITTVRKVIRQGQTVLLTFDLPQEGFHLAVNQGSIAVDGVSLTVSDLTDTSFSVSLVEFTLNNTNLSLLRPGTKVNLEYDVIGKYVARLKDRENKRLTGKRLYDLGF